MKKGEATRQRIVVRTADLLNRRGYLGTPVSKIMRAAGLQKGGIYRHFASRSALTMAAFRYAFERMRDRFLRARDSETTAQGKLLALLEVGRTALHDEAFRGGCPIMNLAIESDDADPELRNAARMAMSRLIGLFEQVIAQGIKNGEFAVTDARAQAISLVTSLEGGIMLCNLYKDQSYLNTVLDDLQRRVRAGFR
jgi:AcrR family transcriptional regulator